MTEEARIVLPSSLTAETVGQLLSSLEKPERRTLVLLGSAEVFCNGIDPDFLLRASGDQAESVAAQFDRCLALIQSYPAPTVAFVQGSALGGGVGLAAACDLVVATEGAAFGLPELLFGFVPGIILPYLAQRIGLQSVRRMAFTGAALTAAQAERIGLVDECDDSADGRALRRWLRCVSRIRHDAVTELRVLLRESPLAGNDTWRARCMITAIRLQQDRNNARALKYFLDDGILPWDRE